MAGLAIIHGTPLAISFYRSFMVKICDLWRPGNRAWLAIIPGYISPYPPVQDKVIKVCPDSYRAGLVKVHASFTEFY
jgi:hypothetical protein